MRFIFSPSRGTVHDAYFALTKGGNDIFNVKIDGDDLLVWFDDPPDWDTSSPSRWWIDAMESHYGLKYEGKLIEQ